MAVVAGFVLLLLMREVVSQTGLSQSEKQEILNAHNRLRGMVNPTASNMQRMEWSDELAEVAQNYAEKCVFEHNSNRLSQQNTFSSVGENLAAGTGTADYTRFIQNWYDEVSDYNFETNQCSDVCGHYTQVVWATSQSLGCGVLRCSQLQNFRSDSVNFVCNYGPAGNFIGQMPYMAGSSCSACPQGQSFCVDNACSSTMMTTQIATSMTAEIAASGNTTMASTTSGSMGKTGCYAIWITSAFSLLYL